MRTMQINCPDEVLISLKETPEEFIKELCMAAAAKLYEVGKLSSGRAAELAGISRVSFLQSLHRYNVSIFDISYEELRKDRQNA